jgi:hypothetical protein
LSKLLNKINCRDNRCAFERVLGCLLYFYGKDCNVEQECVFGDIFGYCKWGIKFEEKDNYPNLPMLKVWTGR